MPDVEDELDDEELLAAAERSPAVATRPPTAYFPCPFFHV